MKKKITGGALYRKMKMNQRFYFLSIAILGLIAFIVFGAVTGDILTGVSMAALVPVIGADGKPELDSEGKVKMRDDNKGDALSLIAEKQAAIKAKQSEIETALEKKADATSIDTLKKELSGLYEDRFKMVEKALSDGEIVRLKQGEAIKFLKDQANNVQYKGEATTLEGALVKAFENAVVSKENPQKLKDFFKDLFSGDATQDRTIEVKVAVDMTTANTIGAGTTQYTLTENTGIISQIRKRELTYLAAVSVGTVGTKNMLWIEETDEQGTPIFIAEGTAKTQLSVLYVEKSESVKKIAVYGKVTTEMMADLPQLISYIQTNLMRRLDIVTEDKLLNATGTGNDPKGMGYYAVAFTGSSLVSTIVAPNELDVIEAIALQVKLAFGQPTTLFVHPSTMSAIRLIKDTTGRPVWKDYITPNGEFNYSGMNIIETTGVTAGAFVGGDTKLVNLRFRQGEEMVVQIGLSGDDFINNKKTILVEKRVGQFVSANDVNCLVDGTFAAAKTLLLKP